VDLLCGSLDAGEDPVVEPATSPAISPAIGTDGLAVLDLALAQVLVRRAGDGAIGPTARVYRPISPTVAFGRRDTRRPGFGRAVRTCRESGFAPVVRAPGGHAVAYTSDSLAIDIVSPDSSGPAGMQRRFVEYGEMLAEAMRQLGIEARVGEVPGEYCPGSHSVNARGKVKLVGTAQRIIRRACLFSAVVIVDGADVLVPLLADIYLSLDLPFDPATVGSVRTEAPDADVDDVEQKVLGVLPVQARKSITADLVDEARSILADHQP
jgi:octanoyl-[GcvH]:protein N-octanoyltransferase